jgi:hypothetical protein
MPQRPTLGFQLFMVLMGAFVGLILIVLHWTWLSLHYARPNSVWGGFARELVWLDLPFAAMLLGLLSIRSKTVVAPLVGLAIAVLTYPLFIDRLLPQARLVPLPNALPSTAVTLASVMAFFAITTVLANVQTRLDKNKWSTWLNYSLAFGYAFFLTVLITYARKIFPHGPYTYATLWPAIAAIVLLGFLAAALFGSFFAVWAGTFACQIGQIILGWVMTGGVSNLGPLVLIFAVVVASFAFPGGYLGELVRNLVLRRQASTSL